MLSTHSSIKGKLFFVIAFVSIGIAATGQSVDPLTGRLQFSIPLGSIQANDISIPVVLSHHGGSLQVAEGEGNCGLGWNISAGGSVTRRVRGLPDEQTTGGWMYNSGAQATAVNSFTPSANDDLSVCSDEATDYATINTLTGYSSTSPGLTKDTEPDIFYVGAPGLSAQFIFGVDGLPKLLTHQDIKIAYGTNLSTFTITTNQGMVYFFGLAETITRKGVIGSSDNGINTEARYALNEIGFTGRWHLQTITSQTTGTVATYGYTSLPATWSVEFLTSDSLNQVIDYFQPKRISSIDLKSYSVDFTWFNRVLSKVEILDSTTQDKQEFFFEYTSISGTGNFAKTFLAKVRQVDNCNALVSFEFEYQDPSNSAVTGNWDKNFMQDFFGYFNGQSGNFNIPTLYYYSGESNGRRLRVNPIPGTTATTTVSGGNRTVNTSLHGYGALTKIKYPTGGFTQIEYDAHKYLDPSTSEEFSGGGVRVKKITRQGGEIAFGKTIDFASTHRAVTVEYEYKLADNSTSGVLLSPVKLGYHSATGIERSVSNLGDEPGILYKRVTEKQSGQGKRVYEYSVPGVFPDTLSGDWKATRSRIARPTTTPCATVGNARNGYYTFPYAPSTNNGKRGLLTKVSEYSEASVLVRDRTESTVELTSNAATVKGLRFERLGDVYHYGLYEVRTGRVEAPYQQVVREASESNPTLFMQTTTTYAYNGNNMVSSVTTTLPDNTVTTKLFKYAKDFAITSPTSTDTMAVAIKKLNDQNRHGQIIEQVSKITLPSQSEKTTGGSLTMFREFHTGRVLPYYSKTTLPGVEITMATSSSSTFTPDNDYFTVRTIKDYDLEGRPLAEFDDKRNQVGYHYATGPSMPAVTIANARGQQAIYEGFEYATSFGLTTSGTTLTTGAMTRTGERAVEFDTYADKLTSSATYLIQKGSRYYRVSCWVYSGSGKKVKFTAKQGATTPYIELTNTVSNQWNYVEGILDINSITGPFTLEITTDAGSGSNVVIVDDVVFIPREARIAFQTAKPFKGVTYATDDRGNSQKNVYDESGRVVYGYDKNRNLVTKNEYLTKVTQAHSVNSNFSSSSSNYEAGQSVTFTAGSSCGESISRTWKVNGASQTVTQPAEVFTYTFGIGQHAVELIVTDAVYGTTSYTESICVKPAPGITVTDANLNPVTDGATFNCNSTNTPLTFTAAQTSAWFKVTYNSIRNEYELVPILGANFQPVIAASFTFYEPAQTIVLARPVIAVTACTPHPAPFQSTFTYNFAIVNCQ